MAPGADRQGNDTTRAAVDRSRYTIGFGAAGVLNVRFDAIVAAAAGNRRVQSEFGPLALTRHVPRGSLHDELLRQWPTCAVSAQDGRLYLALMADGGSIRFESALIRAPARTALAW
jgi:hypothetical protein